MSAGLICCLIYCKPLTSDDIKTPSCGERLQTLGRHHRGPARRTRVSRAEYHRGSKDHCQIGGCTDLNEAKSVSTSEMNGDMSKINFEAFAPAQMNDAMMLHLYRLKRIHKPSKSNAIHENRPIGARISNLSPEIIGLVPEGCFPVHKAATPGSKWAKGLRKQNAFKLQDDALSGPRKNESDRKVMLIDG